MSSTQLKAVMWGWRSYNTINTPVVQPVPQTPVWFSIIIAFGVVAATGFLLQVLYTALPAHTTTFSAFMATVI